MLKLLNIVKDYPAGSGTVRALRGIDLTFRDSEFVSILGPSGCGKTTLLNIVGGLDGYTSGDLVINGKSTKKFKDRDWDTYRNHSIGFVFQSYNLIPHQSVLQNVELALTVSGVSKSERRRRAKEALSLVGLSEQIRKKPNQLSGGQMQRVAIARAIVNSPDIILADEPTGALDTETSIQVMEILKEISKDRLVIMVTHNPDLAEKYSSRVIKMLDGKITDDSASVTDEEEKELSKKYQDAPSVKTKKPTMSFITAFWLSLKNLFTKKGRTALTSFAGSIGIMGIALILAVSQGTTNYINTVQEDTLSSYPLIIEKNLVDMTSLMETFMNVNSIEVSHENDAVYKKSAIYDMLTAINSVETSENDLESFKKYLEEYNAAEEESKLSEAVTGIQYTYDLELLVYTKNVDGNIIKSDTNELFRELLSEYMGADLSTLASFMNGEGAGGGSAMSMNMMSVNLWQEMLSGKNGEPVNDLLKKQYDLVYGSWPNEYNEILLVLDENNELDDLTLYALGLETKEEIDAIKNAALNHTELKKPTDSWTYEEICERDYHIVLNSDCYVYDEQSGKYTDLRTTDAGVRYLYDNGLKLKVTGIIKPNEDAQSAMLTGSIAYTKALTEYVVEHTKKSEVIEKQLQNDEIDIVSGLPFKSNTENLSVEEKTTELYKFISLMNTAEKAEAYINMMSIPSQETLSQMVDGAMAGYTRENIETAMTQGLSQKMGMDAQSIKDYLSGMTDEEINELFRGSVSEQIKAQYAQQTKQKMASVPPEQLAMMLIQSFDTFTDEQYSDYYDAIMIFSDSTYENNLTEMGYVDLDSPFTINIFASSFENKDIIEEAISEYNKDKEELSQIKYTDYVGIMMSFVTTVIDAITYVLLAFVAISLIVSSIMIGVITLISVQERTKEIGILRAIGASKKDVSGMFNAETMIIGLASGLLGVGITYLLCIPINIILHMATGINTLNAVLPPLAAVILVAISILLSLIAGIIPSRSAAKKDPVVALRTE